MNIQDPISGQWERTIEDEILCECEECGEPCKPEDDICALCFLMVAEVQGEA